MVMSPGAQQMGAAGAMGGTDNSAQDFFDKTFSDMAYQAVQQKSPEIAPSIVTFRILASDMDRGHAVGAFLISRNKHIAYIPVVLSDNKIMPTEIIYSKDLGKFLPLEDKWLTEIMKVEDGAMGDPANLPASVNPEVSMRHLLTPPYVGRYGYASDETKLAEDFHSANILSEMLQDPEKKTAETFKKANLEILSRATKEASIQFMKGLSGDSPKLAEWYMNHFDGPRKFAEYFCIGQAQPKTAFNFNPLLGAAGALQDMKAKQKKKKNAEVLSSKAKLSEFKRVFGDEAPAAWKQALKVGYAVKEAARNRIYKKVVQLPDGASELRTNNRRVQGEETRLRTPEPIQGELNIEWPMDNGFYRVYTSDRKTHDVFVMTDRDNFAPIRGLQTEGARHIIIYSDGSYGHCYDTCGTPLTKGQAEESNVYRYITKNLNANGIKRGYGVFIRLSSPDRFDFVGPFNIDQVMSSPREFRAKTTDGYEIILQKDRDRGGKIHFKDSKLCRLSNEYRFVPLTRKREAHFLKETGDVFRALHDGVIRVSEARFDIKFDSHGDLFYVNNRPRKKVATLDMLLNDYGLSLADAEDLMAQVKTSSKRVKIATLNTYGIFKLAGFLDNNSTKVANPAMQGQMMPGAPQGGPPPQQQAPMQGPMPDPAMIEMLMADSAALQQILSEDPALAEHIAMKLQIDPASAGALAQSPTIQQLLGGAPQGGDPAMAQQGGGMPPQMDPAMAQQGGGGMPPQMDPAMMQAQQMGMDPTQMPPEMLAQMGMDPSMAGGAEQTGMMRGEQMTPEAMNPMFQDDPSMLNDPNIFEMAHLDVIIRSPTLKDIVKEYEDILVKSLDHLGRILFAVYVKAPSLKEEIGNIPYKSLEDSVRNLFKNMGETILDLHQNTSILTHTLSNGLGQGGDSMAAGGGIGGGAAAA